MKATTGIRLPSVSRSIGRLMFAYVQAPWRRQRQWIGALLLAVVGLAMLSALYLDVTSQAAIAGRQIQDLMSQITAVQQDTSDLQSKLADVTSTSSLEERAAALGYVPVEPGELQYVQVPGYGAPEPAILVGAKALKPKAASMPPEYTESLFAWLNEHFSGIPAGAAP